MLIKNYNIVLSSELQGKILEIFNEAVMPYLNVKRYTRQNKTNCLAMMSFIAKGYEVESLLDWVKNNSVINGVPQDFGVVLASYKPNGVVYYHGVNAKKLMEENGGYPNLFESYEADPELERVISDYGMPFEETPKVPEEFKKFEEELPDDFFKEDPETPIDVDAQTPEAPKAMDHKEMSEVVKQLQEETKKMVTKELETYRLVLNDDAKAQLQAALEGSIDEITRRVAEIRGKEKVVVYKDKEKKLPDALYHKQFKQLLNLIANKFNIYLYGEAGDGKSHLVKQCAEALGLKFYTQTPSDVIGLLGYTDIHGDFQETPFTLWVKNGGLLYLSEFDNVGDAILSINTALANGYITINKERYDLHKDCVFVADGNTKGNGANAVYCGRNAIDGATLDRFLFVELEHDNKLELSLCGGNTEWLDFINQFRKIRDTKRVRCLATMRASINMARLESIDYPLNAALENVLLKGLPRDVTKMMANEIIVALPENKYAKALSKVAR